MRRQAMLCAGVTAFILASVSNVRADNPSQDGPQPLKVPTELEKLSSFAGKITEIYGKISGAGQVIASVIEYFGGGSTGPNEIQQKLEDISNQITASTTTLSNELAGVDQDIKIITAQQTRTDIKALLGNQLGPAPLGQMDVDFELRRLLGAAVAQSEFTHAYIEVSTDGPPLPGNPVPVYGIGGTAYNSSKGVPWKTVVPDRQTSVNNQSYDWRIGVPTLIEVVTTALLIMDKSHPTFRSDGAFRGELQAALRALQKNLATMIDGVRCGINTNYDDSKPPASGGGSREWQFGCADINTGYNTTYVLSNSTFVAAWQSAISATPYNNPSPANGGCFNAIYLGLQGSHGPVHPVGQGNQYTGNNVPVDCAMMADTFAQPIITSARNSVLSHMPIATMRKLIGLLTQITNSGTLAAPKQWDGCLTSFIPGDTGCKGYSDITLVPTNYYWNFNKMHVASNNGGAFFTQGPPSGSWSPWGDNSNAYWFINQWAQQGKPIAGDFTGDGRSDVALVGGPGWGSIPVAHALGDGAYVVTNAGTGVNNWDCGFETTPSSQCNRKNGASAESFEFNVRNWPLPLDFTLNFNDAATIATSKLSGDFNGDGIGDVALVGGQGWQTIPVAFGDGGGTFSEVTNYASEALVQPWLQNQWGLRDQLNWFPQWATLPGTKAVAGDFNGGGRSDIALVETNGNIDIAFSNGDGTFKITRSGVFDPWWGSWVGTPNVRVVAGDFDGDGRSDIALVGGTGWGSMPTAYSNGDGTFTMINVPVSGSLPTWATSSQVVAGDFDGNHKFDIGLANDQIINYVSYIPEILSLSRGWYIGSMQTRFYLANNPGLDYWDGSTNNSYFTALGAN